jgi:ArsR family transcriptional regulator
LTIYRYIDDYRCVDIGKFAMAFKALAHPHRLAIFLRLSACCRRHGFGADQCARFCVGELGQGLNIGQPTISHHLKELTRAGLISTRKRGQSTECWVAESTLDDLAQFFLKAKRASRMKRAPRR